MSPQFSSQGSLDRSLTDEVHQLWLDALPNHVDLKGFDANASLENRIASALNCGLVIATIYARSSGSIESIKHQLRECVIWAAHNGMYAPPELICIDQTKGGTTAMRAGLERSKSILVSRAASVLLAVNTRRLARLTNQAHSFVRQYVVDQGLRAVMVSQGIDTDDEGIANRIRFGQTGLFLRCGLTSLSPHGYKERRSGRTW